MLSLVLVKNSASNMAIMNCGTAPMTHRMAVLLRHSLPGTDYVRYIERTLKALYDNGIIAGNDLKRMEEDSITAIRLVDKNVATSRFIDQLYTVKEAYEYLLNADTAHYKKNILQQCNLNDYITPNLVYDEEKSEAAQKDLLSNISCPQRGSRNMLMLGDQKVNPL